MARVSIIIATYNLAGYVCEAIASTLQQPLTDLEVVVVDDGSTDNTRELLQQFASDRRLVYIYQENQGATAAFNRGIRESSGEYIGILGADDWYLPAGLVPLAEELDRRPDLGLVAGGYLFVDQDGRKLRESTPWTEYPRLDLETWLMWSPVLFQAALIRKSWLEAVGDLATGLQDWDIGLRLASAGCAMGWVEQLIFAYRMHPSQSVRNADMIRRESLAVLDSYFARPDVPALALSRKHAAYANAHLKGAISGYAAGQIEQAQGDLERACRLDPALSAHRGQALFEMIVAHATYPLTRDAYAFVDAVFAHLPAWAGELRRRRREAIAAAAMSMCFRAHGDRNWTEVRRTWLRGVLNHPAWLRNRGVLAIGLRALAVGASTARG